MRVTKIAGSGSRVGVTKNAGSGSRKNNERDSGGGIVRVAQIEKNFFRFLVHVIETHTCIANKTSITGTGGRNSVSVHCTCLWSVKLTLVQDYYASHLPPQWRIIEKSKTLYRTLPESK